MSATTVAVPWKYGAPTPVKLILCMSILMSQIITSNYFSSSCSVQRTVTSKDSSAKLVSLQAPPVFSRGPRALALGAYVVLLRRGRRKDF